MKTKVDPKNVTVDLLACPFLSCPDPVDVHVRLADDTNAYVMCEGCGTTGPNGVGDTRQEALNNAALKWNSTAASKERSE